MGQAEILITIQRDDLKESDTIRLKNIFRTLVFSDIINMRNGQMILNFDDEGVLRSVDKHIKAWKHKK